MHYVYVLKNDRSDIYIGQTEDISRRVYEHNAGKSISTRGFRWELIYYEAYRCKEDATARERKLKQHGQAKRHLKDRIQASLAPDQ